MSKSISENIFDVPIIENKNSYEFDCYILEKMKQLQNIPLKNFLQRIRKILKEKSSCKMWFSDQPSTVWNYKKKQYCNINFKCCPTSYKARNYFCLILNTENDLISVKDGFLASV